VVKDRIVSAEYWKNFWRNHARATLHAPVQCQVLRTVDKQPLSDQIFAQILTQIEAVLELTSEDVLLDLCCGNGAITARLASRCNRVVGIDCSQDLLDQIDTTVHRNVVLRAEDVAEADLPESSFSKVLLYAGIQYFAEEQIVRLLCRVARCLRPGGLLYLGDVPDVSRIWAFFNSPARETAYFDSLRDDQSIIGTWLDADWLSKLGRYAGFDAVQLLPQPAYFPYAHYRFDMIMRKS